MYHRSVLSDPDGTKKKCSFVSFAASNAPGNLKIIKYLLPLISRHTAEGEGFEPPVPVRVRPLSRREPSTTRPSFHTDEACSAALQASSVQVTPPARPRRRSCPPHA